MERGEGSMSPLDWLKAMSSSLSLAGTAYEPWVQLLQFLLLVVGSLSLITRLLPRRGVAAVAEQVWSLLKQAGRAFVHANRYAPAPALERRLTRLFLYGDLVSYSSMGALGVLLTLLMGAYLVLFMASGVWSWSVLALLCFVFYLCYARLNFVAASWAWYSIKTGQKFTWPMIRPR
jgi:hypothetical protein